MVWTTILLPFLAIPLFATASNATSALLDMLMIWGGCALLALCHALWWCFVPGRTQYVCDGQTLKALRGGRVIKEIDCSTIRELHLVSRLTWVRITFTNVLPPNTPWLMANVNLPRGGTRGVSFPRILIWGHDPIERAEAALAEAAGVLGKSSSLA